VSVNSNYTSFNGSVAGITGHSSSEGGRLQYEHSVSPRANLLAYGTYEYLFGFRPCPTYGGGLGAELQPNAKVSIALEAGPQFNGTVCGGEQGANFRGFLGYRPDRRSSIVLSVARDYTSVYTIDTSWSNNISISASHQFRFVEPSIDASYFDSPSQSIDRPAYRGTFVSPQIRWKLLQSLSLLFGYRHFHGTFAGVSNADMNFGAISLEWNPAPIGFPR